MSKSHEEIVQEFCKRLNPDVEAVILDIKPADGAKPLMAKQNVDAKVAADGGTGIEGWAIWYQEDVLVEGEPHAVWKSPAGELVDVTPREGGYPQVMFLAQDGVWSGDAMPGHKRQAITDSQTARAVFVTGEWRDRLRKQYGTNEDDFPADEVEKMNAAFQRILARDARNWERCPCGSNKQFAKCCGKPKSRPRSNF